MDEVGAMRESSAHARAQRSETRTHDSSIQSTSYRPDFIQISSMGAFTREPWGTPLRSSESLQLRGFLESHCKYARLSSTIGTTTNPKARGSNPLGRASQGSTGTYLVEPFTLRCSSSKKSEGRRVWCHRTGCAESLSHCAQLSADAIRVLAFGYFARGDPLSGRRTLRACGMLG